MENDIRQVPSWRAVEEHFTSSYGPAFGRIGSVLEVAAAPDGRRAAFIAEVRSPWPDRPDSQLHLLDLDTGHVRALTDGAGHDRSPCWSPDGSRVAFRSDRDNAGRFGGWLAQAGTGQLDRGPALPGSVEYLAWSPDGRRLLLGVHRAPDHTPPPPPAPTVRATGDDRGDRSVWLWEPSDDTARRVGPTGLSIWEADWCGSDLLAATVSDDPTENSWYTAWLALLDPTAGTARRLYSSDRQLSLPVGADDGRHVAVIESWCSDRGVAAGALLLIDTDSGTAGTVDTGGVDVTDLAFGHDCLWYAGIREPQTAVGEVDPATGRVTERWADTDTCGQFYPQIAPLPAHKFLAVRQSYRHPPDLAVFSDGQAHTVLSAEHAGHQRLRKRSGTLEHVAWRASDGLSIGGFLCRPDTRGPHPLVLHIHGGPVLAFRNRWQLGYPLVPLLVSHGYAVLCANPRGSTGRGRDYVDAVAGDMGGADVDDLLAGLDAMIDRGVTEPGRLGVTGHSYGGYLSCLLVGRTDRFAAAVAASSVTDWQVQHYASDIGWFDSAFLDDVPHRPGGRHFTRSPIAYAHRVSTPTLLVAGAADTGVPPVQSGEFHAALADRGVPSALAVYPGEGHVLRGQRAILDFHARLLDWFTRWLPV